LNPKPHEEQLEDKKSKKTQEGHLEEGKTTMLTKGIKRDKPSKMVKKI
jgi:hypothetical protein